jgi:hypothetical protein
MLAESKSADRNHVGKEKPGLDLPGLLTQQKVSLSALNGVPHYPVASEKRCPAIAVIPSLLVTACLPTRGGHLPKSYCERRYRALLQITNQSH